MPDSHKIYACSCSDNDSIIVILASVVINIFLYAYAITNTLRSLIIAALVGFEFPSYIFNENSGGVEICVVVSSPTENEVLLFNIITVHVTRSGTAGDNI